jgi:hypothetical protein
MEFAYPLFAKEDEQGMSAEFLRSVQGADQRLHRQARAVKGNHWLTHETEKCLWFPARCDTLLQPGTDDVMDITSAARSSLWWIPVGYATTWKNGKTDLVALLWASE